MKVLIACEVNGKVRDAFRANGADAYSCDIEPNNSPFHLCCDIKKVLYDSWDLIVAFPPCTHLCVSGSRWWVEKRADGSQEKAANFFGLFVNLNCPYAIENPIGIMSTLWRKPDQIIQPWQFGHGEVKATCLWLNKVPLLKPTNIVSGREARIHKMGPSKDRSKNRSETYQGIADAMGKQWSNT